MEINPHVSKDQKGFLKSSFKKSNTQYQTIEVIVTLSETAGNQQTMTKYKNKYHSLFPILARTVHRTSTSIARDQCPMPYAVCRLAIRG